MITKLWVKLNTYEFWAGYLLGEAGLDNSGKISTQFKIWISGQLFSGQRGFLDKEAFNF